MDGHYDRREDIAWVRFDDWAKDEISVEPGERGLVERDRTSGRVVGLEFWNASDQLPAELLQALPHPPSRSISIERQRA